MSIIMNNSERILSATFPKSTEATKLGKRLLFLINAPQADIDWSGLGSEKLAFNDLYKASVACHTIGTKEAFDFGHLAMSNILNAIGPINGFSITQNAQAEKDNTQGLFNFAVSSAIRFSCISLTDEYEDARIALGNARKNREEDPNAYETAREIIKTLNNAQGHRKQVAKIVDFQTWYKSFRKALIFAVSAQEAKTPAEIKAERAARNAAKATRVAKEEKASIEKRIAIHAETKRRQEEQIAKEAKAVKIASEKETKTKETRVAKIASEQETRTK